MKKRSDPANLIHTAALPEDLVTAPTNLTCTVLNISVMALAMKALARTAKKVKTAKEPDP
jgi:hypothetical protein